MKTLPLYLGLIFCLSLAGCRESTSGSRPSEPTRTILIYLGGDNDLSNQSTAKLDAIRRGFGDSRQNVLIYHDPSGKAPVLYKLMDVDGEPVAHPLATYSEENSASPEVLNRVLKQVFDSYPAQSGGLLVFSHASGWLPAGALEDPNEPSKSRSVMNDREAGAEMELADFAAAIPDGAFDFIVFEMCFMTGVEVVYALREKTEYILASSAEILSPGFTSVYPSSFSHLLNDAVPVSKSLRNFADDYYQSVLKKTGNQRSATLSVLRTAPVDRLATLCAEILRHTDQEIDLSAIQHFDRPGSYGDSPALPRFFDLRDLLSALATAEQLVRLDAILEEMVVWRVATENFMIQQNGFEIRTHSGLTVYSEQEAFPYLNDRYHEQDWYLATH